MDTASQRIVVTGANGRLGTATCELFASLGLDFVGTDISVQSTTTFEVVTADLRDYDEVRTVLDGAHAVVHLGNHPGLGNTPPHLIFNENVAINENVFQCASELGLTHIVFASTIQLFGSKPDLRTVSHPPTRPPFPITSDTVLAPSNLYSLSKQVSEVMLKFYAERCGLTTTALRLPLLHHNERHFTVSTGNETEHDVFEGFTSLTYTDAAELILAVLRSDLDGFNAFSAGVADRHLDLELSELASTFFPELPPHTKHLIDLTPIYSTTGWWPTPSAWK